MIILCLPISLSWLTIDSPKFVIFPKRVKLPGLAWTVFNIFCCAMRWMSRTIWTIISCLRIIFGSKHLTRRSSELHRLAPCKSAAHNCGYFFHRRSITFLMTDRIFSRCPGGRRRSVLCRIYSSASWKYFLLIFDKIDN